ncbi:hypothetical protein [Ensifer sp. MJa1]|uniref:hypothetical protein n=1 Tax=Ensifer sp. MJa1 TaxID=2919888 RepID=UPI00300BDEDD
MKTISWTTMMAAATILINASVPRGDDLSPPGTGAHYPWAKVVVNHPIAKHGTYYKGVSPTAMPTSHAKRLDAGRSASR